jgi:hypothetical protein
MKTWTVVWQTLLARLRAWALRGRGAKLGRQVSVGPGCRAWLARGIELGERVTLEGEVWSNWCRRKPASWPGRAPSSAGAAM